MHGHDLLGLGFSVDEVVHDYGDVWGHLDMAGNVNEWNADSFAAYVDPCTDCADLAAGSFRVIRGGYFDSEPSQLSPGSRSDDPATARSICLGFRCARAP